MDVIEAGFPISSPGDIGSGARRGGGNQGLPRGCARPRQRQEDVDAALRGIEPAAKPQLHIYGHFDLHLKHKLRISRGEALAQITKAVAYGCTHCDDVEFSAEDAGRTDLDFLS